MRNLFSFYFDSLPAAFKAAWKLALEIATAIGIFVAFVLDRTRPEPPLEALMKTLLWLIPVVTFVVVFFVVILLYVPYMKYKKLKSEFENREKELNAKIEEKEQGSQRAKDQLEIEKSELRTRLEAEKAELQSQLEAERAKLIVPKIEGEIQEIFINDTKSLSEKIPQVNAIIRTDDLSSFHQSGPQLGVYVTLKVFIINSSPILTRVKTFSLKIRIKGRLYESQNFHTGVFYKASRHRRPKSFIPNLADALKRQEGLKPNLAEDGYLRFFVVGAIPTEGPPSHDEGWGNNPIKQEVFDLDDVKDVTLIVTDYSTDYTIVALDIKPQWAEVTQG